MFRYNDGSATARTQNKMNVQISLGDIQEDLDTFLYYLKVSVRPLDERMYQPKPTQITL